ncbi:hypothetical protein [Pseudomonas sp. NFR16]|uniref:hypothetical protein n=1 Tax=Pseudomonas sp. NFR16 TaxID=1566248 RepID=UPI0008C565CB|nr:hypothetical protein [Pseudomonas sp. NFR16]SEJ19142.1 hypothetical protein SAMN03159495_2641 [Pseudomonas sp. NFR16]
MLQNFSIIRERLSNYVVVPDRKFLTDSGASAEEESISQKVRQYWADETVSNAQKLKGFNLDISGFDPRNTTNRELREIGSVLVGLGIIDYGTSGWLSGIDIEFDAQGNEIGLNNPVDMYDYFERQLTFLSGCITEGRSFANDTLTKLKTVMSVTQALDERAKRPPPRALVNIRA